MSSFTPAQSSSRIEIQGCLYNFETPNSKLKIKYFQSAVGREIPNGLEFLKYLKPVRELLPSSKIKDIRQLVQRELDDVRIIKSMVPYLLNDKGMHGDSGIAFFPSVLGVIMPKDYLNSLEEPYPKKNKDKEVREDNFKIDYYESESFNWSVKSYYDSGNNPISFASLTLDRETCDVVIIDGQHRINAFRAACESLSTDNSVIKQVYGSCQKYKNSVKVNLPITLIWFEPQDDTQDFDISPEIISRKLFIDVNSSARSIATSRRILLDDRSPVNLLTNQFYSLIAKEYGFSLDEFSLAQLGFDVPNEVSQQSTFNSMPISYITTPERIKYIFHSFFIRSKSYSIRLGKKSLEARLLKYSASISKEVTSNNELKEMLPNSSDISISLFTDEYEEKEILFVSDDLLPDGQTKQELVRDEFSEQYFECFYKLFGEFGYFKQYLGFLSLYNKELSNHNDLDKKETWISVFLEGKSLFYALKNKTQDQNKYSSELTKIEDEFRRRYLKEVYQTYTSEPNTDSIVFLDNTLEEVELFTSFRTLAFQIGYVLAFYEYCKIVHSCQFESISKKDLNLICDEYIAKVNKIGYKEWVNYFAFLRDLQGETHPKNFPVIMHLILRKIQEPNTIFDASDQQKYLSPECVYFYQKTVLCLNRIIERKFGKDEIKAMKLDDLLKKNYDVNTTYRKLFEEIIQENKKKTCELFKDKLMIETTYLDDLYPILEEDIYSNLKVKK